MLQAIQHPVDSCESPPVTPNPATHKTVARQNKMKSVTPIKATTEMVVVEARWLCVTLCYAIMCYAYPQAPLP